MTRPPLAIAVSLALAASAFLSGCDNASRLSTEEHIQRAVDFESKGNLQGSIVELKNAVQKAPTNPQARLALGEVYLKAGLGAEAEKELSQALKLGIDDELVRPKLGEAILMTGDYQRVLDEIQPGESASKENRARIYQIRADALLKKGQLKDACALFQQAYEIDANSPPTYWGLAQCAVAEGDLAKARSWLDAALKLDVDQARTWIFIGDWEQLSRKPQEALAAYSNALKAAPNNRSALENRATLNLAMGQLDAARADIEKLSRLAPKSVPALYLQALLSFEEKKFPEARDRAQEVFKLTSDHMPSVLVAGATDYALGSYKQAESHLGRYLARFPGNTYARRVLAATQIKQKQADEALQTLGPLVGPGSRDVEALLLAAEAYRVKRDPARGAEFLGRAKVIAPDNAAIQTELALSRLAAGESDLAIAELSRAAALDPEQHRADVLLVMAHLDRKQYDKALAALPALEKKLGSNPLPHALRGSALLGKNDVAGARRSFERALAIEPTYFPATAKLAELDLRDRKPDAARKRFERILEKDKTNLQAMMALAELAARQNNEKDYVAWLERAAKAHPRAIPPRAAQIRHLLAKKETQKALAIANETLTTNPDDPAALDLLGSVQLEMNDINGALSTFTKLTRLATQSPDAHLRLALAQIEAKRLPDARNSLNTALKLQPDHAPSLDALIRLEMRDGKPDQALRIARQLQASHPKSPLGYEREGDIHLTQKDPASALKAYDQALARNASSALFIKSHRANVLAASPAAEAQLKNWLSRYPKDTMVRFYAAEHYTAAGRKQDAIAAYESLLVQNPGNAIALNNLANLYQEVGDKRALATAEKAHKLAPEHPAILDTLGWILVEQGQAARGLELIEKALAKMPGNPDLRYHRAVAWARMGETARARRELEALLREAPTFSQAEAARAQLRKL